MAAHATLTRTVQVQVLAPQLLPPLSSGLGRRPLKAETPVRIWLEVSLKSLYDRLFCFLYSARGDIHGKGKEHILSLSAR